MDRGILGLTIKWNVLVMQNVLGCLARSGPYNNLTAQDGVCDGVGCCQVALTDNMSNYGTDFLRRYNTTNMSTTDGAEYCGYAVMMEARAFHFRTTYLNTTEFWKENDGRVPVILNWAVGNETCDIAKTNATSYACVSNNSTCIDSVNGPGYLCNCTEGYHGNPYLPDGCQGSYWSISLIDAFKHFMSRFLILAQQISKYDIVCLQILMSVLSTFHLHARGIARTQTGVSFVQMKSLQVPYAMALWS
jgi:hypothetical protein